MARDRGPETGAPGISKQPRPENTRKGIDAHVALAQGRGARPSAVAEMQARISPELWRQVLQAHPFLAALDDQEGAQLLARSAWLLASKSINGAQGLTSRTRCACRSPRRPACPS